MGKRYVLIFFRKASVLTTSCRAAEQLNQLNMWLAVAQHNPSVGPDTVIPAGSSLPQWSQTANVKDKRHFLQAWLGVV